MFLVENQIKFFTPEFFFASVLLFIVLQNSLIIDNKNYKNPLLVSITLQISSLTFLTFLGLLLNSCAVNFFMFSESNFIFDTLGLNVKLFLTFFSIIVFLFCFDHIYETKINLFEYVFLKLLAVLSLCFLVMANDLLGIYIIIEIQSLCLYALASFKRNSAFSTEAGIKYFVLGSFASCFLLIGIATIYCSIGSTNLQDVQYLLTSLNKTILFFDTINIGLFFIASSFLFKLAIFPFHLWIADVYEGSSTSSSIFFSLIPKIAIFVVLIRIFEYSFYSTFYNWESCLSLLAIFSILYGSFIAIKQKKIKRLLAFSAIAHMGYVLLAFSTSTFEGLESMFFYLFIYTITGFLTWSIVLILESDFNSNNTKTIADISNFFKLNFSFSIIIAAAFFSLAGTPPFVGFYAKLSILCSVINSSSFFYAFVAFLTSVISCFYYLRIIKNSFFEKHFEWFSYINFNVLISYSLSTINFLMVGLFINPNLILSLTQRIVFLF